MTLNTVIISFLVPVIAAILCIRAIKRFMDFKIEQWSFEYQVFGFGGALVAVFGLFNAFGNLSIFITQ